uniref:Bifunctional inhibitor/plant lipid transfer protein/seed storage helical domain-containing protein n=1 Tax=Oryza meridionalis TaxID=40149 RepID=A0A0E0ENM4_9ORYZ
MEIKLVFLLLLLLLGCGNAEEELDTETCDVAKLSAEIGTYCEFDQGRMYPGRCCDSIIDAADGYDGGALTASAASGRRMRELLHQYIDCGGLQPSLPHLADSTCSAAPEMVGTLPGPGKISGADTTTNRVIFSAMRPAIIVNKMLAST